MATLPSRPAIRATGLRKSFGDQVVLDGIDLQVPEGTVFALLGPNGAGKTTMVQILSTLIGADAGEVRVAGHDLAQEPDAVRAVIGVTGQFSAVDQLLTGEENLLLMADLGHLDRAEGRRRAAELLDRFDLVEAARKPAGPPSSPPAWSSPRRTSTGAAGPPRSRPASGPRITITSTCSAPGST
jgi:ABC-2 type transport system ATP-binding protein